MKSFLLLPLLVLTLATGCSPSDSSGNSPQTTGSTNRSMTNDGAFGQYMGGLQQAKQNAGKTVDVASLTRVIQQYFVDKGHYPADLNELVQEKYIRELPPVPAGMKLDYNSETGDLKVVNQ